MDDLPAALALLYGLNFRDRIAEEERIPAWRAIKALYRAGVPEEDCETLVRGIRSLGSPARFGPTLKYHLDRIRLRLEREGIIPPKTGTS